MSVIVIGGGSGDVSDLSDLGLTGEAADYNDAVSKKHTQAHDIDSASDHNGVDGAAENNFLASNAGGLPIDSGYAAANFDTAGTASDAVTTHQITEDHHTQLHDLASASDHNGITGATSQHIVVFSANDGYPIKDGGALIADLMAKADYDSGDDGQVDSADVAHGLVETDGPTTLTMGAITDGQFIKRSGSNVVGAADPGLERAIEFVIDGSGSAITTGIKGDIEVPFACSIQSATLLADQSGDIVIDIWKDTYANFAPTDDDSITASAPPTISSGIKSQDATLTGWTKSLSKGDILRFNVDSCATIERVTLSLKVNRS